MIAVPYIHALAPRVIELLGQLTTQIAGDDNVSKMKHDVLTEALQVLETLVDIADDGKSK